MKIIAAVKPGSSQEKVLETAASGDERSVTVWTHARAHDGEANKKVTALLADFYNIPKTSLKLTHGETSRKKIFVV